MTPEQINIAIAEACGWIEIGNREGTTNTRPVLTGKHPVYVYTEPIPNYFGSLDACHEMEKVLTDDQGILYGSILAHIRTRFTDSKWMWHADATQRCEAFLKTIGKWKESDR